MKPTIETMRTYLSLDNRSVCIFDGRVSGGRTDCRTARFHNREANER